MSTKIKNLKEDEAEDAIRRQSEACAEDEDYRTHRYMVALVEIVVPLPDVSVKSSDAAKQGAVTSVVDRIVESLPDDIAREAVLRGKMLALFTRD